ncbi:MAG TPA: phosphotransferase family protein [Acidimicrobiales bacterium]|nr:phosphotransferase family protein [Acidimicrobiales bacterium]
MTTSGPELSEALARVLEPDLGIGVRVSGLQRLAGGSSRETWAFTAHLPTGDETRRLVLRCDPPGAPSSGLSLESALLEAARRAGVPVPAVVTAGDAHGPLGRAFVVVDHVEGETLPRRILRRVEADGTGPALTAQCGQALAAVHAIAPATVPGLTGGDPLEQLRGLLDVLRQPHPAFELALRWLAESRPARSAETVVHGDFRNGNLIVGPEGIRAVLDWELAHRGDPMEDLGWLCVKAWRFGGAHPVGGFGTVDQLVRAYEAASGRVIDRAALGWWEVLGTVRWGVICIVQTMTHVSGAHASVELAAIGRRVCEVEWDVLELVP